MKPVVLTSLYGNREFFMVDEKSAAEDIIKALKLMRGGYLILVHLKSQLGGGIFEETKKLPVRPVQEVRDEDYLDH